MIRWFIGVVVVVFLVGCHAAKNSLEKGNFDTAIHKSVKKLQKNPNHEESLQVLEQAYKKAVEENERRIEFLRKEGQPDNWNKIHAIYVRMEGRQNKVRRLQNIPSGIQFKNYNDEIIHSKQKAAEYYYANAMRLLEKEDRRSARQAYDEFLRVKSYYPNFRDVDDKIELAKEQGISNVLFKMENKTGVPLPPKFESELKKISITGLNKKWLRYYLNEREGLFFDYFVVVNMQIIDVSPESEKVIHYEEKKEVRDGWDYVLDENGNVKKDSLGNDIKTPKYKLVTCKVIEKQQSKNAIIKGSIDYVDTRTGELLKSDPVVAETFWKHRSGLAIGNVEALKSQTKKIIGVPPAPYPNDFDLLLDAGETLKSMTKEIIDRNKNVLY